jgi:hypothetical protein
MENESNFPSDIAEIINNTAIELSTSRKKNRKNPDFLNQFSPKEVCINLLPIYKYIYIYNSSEIL